MYRFRTFVLSFFLLSSGLFAQVAVQQQPAADLINQVVQKELSDRGRPDVWLYHVEHTQAAHTESRIQADTTFGPIYRVLARDGAPLTPAQQHADDVRVTSLLSDKNQMAKNRQQHIDDERHLENLMALMPRGFLYEYDGADDGKLRLKFRPNPNFEPPTYEGRVFHGLTGTILIDPVQKRISRMVGTLQQPVEFGFGILGRLEKGGTFEFRRVPVTDMRWKTSWIELHVIGRIIFIKSIAKDQKELRSGFVELPTNTTLQQARDLLYK